MKKNLLLFLLPFLFFPFLSYARLGEAPVGGIAGAAAGLPAGPGCEPITKIEPPPEDPEPEPDYSKSQIVSLPLSTTTKATTTKASTTKATTTPPKEKKPEKKPGTNPIQPESAKALAAAADKALKDKKSLVQTSPRRYGCSSTVCSIMSMAGFDKGNIPITTNLASNLENDPRLKLIWSGRGPIGIDLQAGDVVVTATETLEYKNKKGQKVQKKVVGHTGVVDNKGGIVNNSSATGIPKSTEPSKWDPYATRGVPGGNCLKTSVFRAVK
jgi:hypothetical protein